MLKIQELANFISENLNIISATAGASYVFDIYAEVGHNENDGHIKGVVRSLQNNPLIVKSLVSVKTVYAVELSIPVGMANKNLAKIEEIVDKFAETYEDTQHTFTTGVGSFEFTFAHLPKDFKIDNTIGSTVPLAFELTVNFTDNGLLGSSKVWKLDGAEIPYLNEVILLNKEGQTNRISKEKYNKTIVLAQTKFYKFTIPFDKTNTVCTTLQADLLAGDFDKTYTLTYYDGTTYTSTAPFTTTVSLYQSGDSASDGGAISKFTVTFADVSASEIAPKYTLELFSTPFDENNERYFEGVQQQTNWYNALPMHAPAVQIKAPNLNTISNTTQVYNYTGSGYTPEQLANMNVARINEKKDEQSYQVYQIKSEQVSKYIGTIVGGGETINYTVIDTAPVVINGVTYYLSVNNGVYTLRDGGGNQIPITNNTFELGEYYYLVESDNYYSIVDSQNNTIAQISKDTAHPQISKANITLGTHDDLELFGIWDNELNRYNFTLTGQDIDLNLTYRTLTRSNEDYFTQYWWVEATASGYNVGIFSGRPRLSDFDWTGLSIGDLITTYNNEDLYLASPTQIVGSGGTVINLSTTLPMYYQFELDTIQYYLDNATLQGTINASDITIYDNTYSLIETISYAGASVTFTINSEQYVLTINESAMIITKQGFIFADITETRLFTIGTDYVLTQSQVDTETVLLIKQGTAIITRCTPATTHDYSFVIQGITYYVDVDEDNKYDIYYSGGGELAPNVEDGGDFRIPTGEFNRYYYTIQSSEIGANNQIILTLKLNTFQTYVINPDLKFSECFINKAHLNRFVDNGDGTVSFNGGIESPLFEREEAKNVAKRLVSKRYLNYDYGFGVNHKDIQSWINENVLGWVYAYIPNSLNISQSLYWYGQSTYHYTFKLLETLKYSFYGQKDSGLINLNNTATNIDSNFVVFCAPIYKTSKRILLSGEIINIFQLGNLPVLEKKMVIDYNHLKEFIQGELVNDESKVVPYTLKFSSSPPALFNSSTALASIVGGNLWLVSTQHKEPITRENIEKLEDKTYIMLSVGNYIGVQFSNAYYDVTQGILKGALYLQTSPIDLGLDDYTILNALTFPKNNNNYISNTYFTLGEQEIGRTAPQQFVVTRPTPTNIGEISFVLNYIDSSSDRHSPTKVCPNIKGTYIINSVDGEQRIEITESAIYFTIQAMPNDFWKFTSIDFNYNVYGLVGADKNPIYNPKLLSSDYRSLKLTDGKGGEFEYDIQKLNLKTLKTSVSSPMTADLQRSYFRVTNIDGIYNIDCANNLTGMVESSDNSIPLSSSKMQQVLAEQPNYFMQKTVSNIDRAVKTVGGGFAGGFGGSKMLGLPISGVSGGVIGMGASILSAIPSFINEYLSEDNMRKSPNTIQNANGNVIFNLGYSEPELAIEQYALLPQEERIINDQMFANGYTYNRIDQIRNFMHTRKYFNTLIASIETMSGLPLSNEVREDIKQRFANGIRMWHTDDIQYEKENYELWLEE